MSLKSILGQLRLKQMRSRIECRSVHFPLALHDTKHVLVCLPRGLRALTVLKQFLPSLKEMFRPAEITLMLSLIHI